MTSFLGRCSAGRTKGPKRESQNTYKDELGDIWAEERKVRLKFNIIFEPIMRLLAVAVSMPMRSEMDLGIWAGPSGNVLLWLTWGLGLQAPISLGWGLGL